MVAKCTKCLEVQICSISHLEEVHEIKITSYEEIMKEIEERTETTERKKLSHKKFWTT